MGSNYAVKPARLLDGAVLALFTVVVSAFVLYTFKAVWSFALRPEYEWLKVGLVLTTVFPFKHNFEYNLTHVFLFAVCTLLFCLGNACNCCKAGCTPSKQGGEGVKN